MTEVVLSMEDDPFYRDIMFKNFGDVAEAIHSLVQRFLKDRKTQTNF